MSLTSPTFALHTRGSATPHVFDEVPRHLTIACRVGDEDVVLLFENSTQPDTRDRLPLRPAVEPPGDDPDEARCGVREAPVFRRHPNMDSFIGAIADCREAGGDSLPCDNPRRLLIGYVHHPVEGDSVVHEIALRDVKGTTVSEDVAARIGLTPAEVRTHLGTHEGREFLVTGRFPEPEPEQDAELAAAMLAAPLDVDIRYDPETGKVADVTFPDHDLFRDVTEGLVDLVTQTKMGSGEPPPGRPEWLPDGWSVFVLPGDAGRVGIPRDDRRPEGTGYFARRGNRMFRAFSDGAWDIAAWHPREDAETRFWPGGYRPEAAGVTTDARAAVDVLLPHYLGTEPAVP
jgi:hypothetical protein